MDIRQNNTGKSFLAVVKQNAVTAAQFLIKEGKVDLGVVSSEKDFKGYNILDFAFQNDNPDMVKLLVKNGAVEAIATTALYTALETVTKTKNGKIPPENEKKEFANFCQLVCNEMAKNDCFRFLKQALDQGRWQCILAFLQNYVLAVNKTIDTEIELTDSKRKLVYHVDSSRNNLLYLGLKNVFLEAAVQNQNEIVIALLPHIKLTETCGADIIDTNGASLTDYTVLDIAVKKRNIRLIEVIIAYGEMSAKDAVTAIYPHALAIAANQQDSDILINTITKREFYLTPDNLNKVINEFDTISINPYTWELFNKDIAVNKNVLLNQILNISDPVLRQRALWQALMPDTWLGKFFYTPISENFKPQLYRGRLAKIVGELTKIFANGAKLQIDEKVHAYVVKSLYLKWKFRHLRGYGFSFFEGTHLIMITDYRSSKVIHGSVKSGASVEMLTSSTHYGERVQPDARKPVLLPSAPEMPADKPDGNDNSAATSSAVMMVENGLSVMPLHLVSTPVPSLLTSTASILSQTHSMAVAPVHYENDVVPQQQPPSYDDVLSQLPVVEGQRNRKVAVSDAKEEEDKLIAELNALPLPPAANVSEHSVQEQRKPVLSS